MKRVIFTIIFSTLVILFTIDSCLALKTKDAENRRLTFFMIHFEVGASNRPWYKTIVQNADVSNLKYQETLWPTALQLVNLAEKYNVKLTLSFNPQWAEYILKDDGKIKKVKEWQNYGHEISFHYHSFTQDDWCGFSDLSESENDPRYRGTFEQGLEFVKELAKPELLITGTKLQIHVGGGKNNSNDARQKPTTMKKWGKIVFSLSHGRLMVNGDPPAWQPVSLLSEFKDEYARIEYDEVFGVVVHCHDFYYRPDIVEEWFKFIQEQTDKIRTVKDIAQELGFVIN